MMLSGLRSVLFTAAPPPEIGPWMDASVRRVA
jgi:hypothetical protein